MSYIKKKDKIIKVLVLLPAILVTVLVLFIINIKADDGGIVASGTCGDNLTWILDDNGTLTISGEGEMEDYTAPFRADLMEYVPIVIPFEAAPWYEYRNKIISVIIEPGAESIGNYAFRSCNKLQSISIPNSVRSIGNDAFSGCSSVAGIDIPSSVISIGSAAFKSCSSLTSIDIPDGITRIANNTFNGCRSLSYINIPDGVTSIGREAFESCGLKTIIIPVSVTCIEKWAFSYCSGLTGITIPHSVTSIDQGTFQNCSSLACIEIPEGVISIGDDAFRYCDSLTRVDIPETVDSIGAYAFYECSSLTGIEIPNSVTSIGNAAFSNCSSLKTIVVDSGNTVFDSRNNCNAIIETETDVLVLGCGNTIVPNGIKSIGDGAFYDCNNLISIDIPSSVVSIGDEAFNECTGLTGIVLPDSMVTIGSSAFSGCTGLAYIDIPGSVTSIGSNAFGSCYSLTDIEIPGSVTSIGASAFYGCTGLTDIEIPDSITIIENGTFRNCTSLINISIPDSVTSIGMSAFSGCVSLETVNIPDSVTEIGNEAFYNCSSLTGIEIQNGITSIENAVFHGCTSLESVDIPDSVTVIGDNAFEYCSSLININIPDSVKSIGCCAFFNCSSMTAIVIPDGVTIIDSSTFNGCTNLATAQIPDSVTDIGMRAFYGCISLTDIDIPNHVNNIAQDAFMNCKGLTEIIIPESVTSIESDAFAGCTSVETIIVDPANAVYDSRDYCDAIIETDTNTLILGCNNTIIPHDIEIIGASAFEGCSSLTNIDIPYGVKIISYAAFRGCSGLVSVEIPETVETIGTYAFTGCSGLTDLVIPFSVTSLDGSSFSDCGGLKSISVDSANPVYDSRNDCNAIMESETDALIRGCDNTVIPDNVKSIGEYALDGSTGLTSIEIPGSVSSIGKGAFSDCCNLTSIIIADGVESIGGWAFSGCSKLTSVVIPDSVTRIDSYAFSECGSLMSITLPDNLTSIRRSMFQDCSIVDVYYKGTEEDWEDKFYVDGGMMLNYHIANLFTSDNLDTSLSTDISLTNVPGGVTVTMSSAGSIRYTLDGSIPCSISAPYEGTFILEVPGEYFINARAFDLENGTYGQITTEHIIIGQSTKPVISERDGQVIISGDGDIYYSLDITSDPSTDSYQYAAPLSFDETTVIKARCIETGKAASEVVGYTFYVSTGSGLEFPAETYSFNNTKQSFGYTGFVYKIPEERYTEIFGNSVGKMLYDIYGSDAWGGSCFGMSATSILFHKGMLNLRDYSDAAENVNSLLAPASPDSMLTQLIERYQISQFLPEVMKERGDVTEGGNMVISNLSGNTKEAETLLDAVRGGLAGGDPVILIVWRQDLAGSHAVVPYRVENGRIYVYDCNDPGTEKYISYSMNANGIYSFRFGDYSYAVSYNRFSVLMSGLESSVDIGNAILQSDNNTSRMLISIDSKDVSILDVNGREITKRISYHATEDMETSNTVLCLDTGAYRIVNHDSSKSSLTVSAATDDDYQKLTVQDPNAVIEVQERNGKVSICVRSDHDTAIESYIMSGAGFTNSVSLTSNYAEIYSVAVRAVSVRTMATGITVNGITEEIKDEESDADVNFGLAMNRDIEKSVRLYSENAKYSLSTDITQLPGEDFNLTVFTTGGDENVMLYVASYSTTGCQIDIKGMKMTAGKTRYPFSISRNTETVKVYMLTTDGGVPVISNISIQ